MRQYLNWKTYLSVMALLIVGASLYYTNQLAGKLADEERKKVLEVAEAIKTISSSGSNNQETGCASNIIIQNKTIPLIYTNENGVIQGQLNIDTVHSLTPRNRVVQEKLEEFKQIHPVIVADFGTGKNYVY